MAGSEGEPGGARPAHIFCRRSHAPKWGSLWGPLTLEIKCSRGAPPPLCFSSAPTTSTVHIFLCHNGSVEARKRQRHPPDGADARDPHEDPR